MKSALAQLLAWLCPTGLNTAIKQSLFPDYSACLLLSYILSKSTPLTA
jgi:hypothetical protein